MHDNLERGKKTTVVIVMDLSKALDKDHHKLVSKLTRLGINLSRDYN
jgi:hypothetical protein